MDVINNLWNVILSGLANFDFFDVVDIVVVTVFFYYVLLAIRGTRAVQIVQGLFALLVVWGLALLFDLKTLSYILSAFLVSTLVGLPVVFQPELRRTLMRLGQQGLLHNTALVRLEKEELDHLVEEISFACFNLSLTNYGALIVLERETGLQEVIESGQLVRSIISAKLLQTIFHPKTPLHDGAVVIRGKALEAAACYLPLTDSVIDTRFGTRHRAAIGISEQSDAVVVVVSEETGEMRIASEGRFSAPMQEEEQLRAALNKILTSDQQKNRVSTVREKIGLRWAANAKMGKLFGFESTAESQEKAFDDSGVDG
ncbi:MAG: diadenylate cyclase CdaA [bacterium]|nr:diadenylate cyclase CdaA [bacterium]